MFVRTLTRRVHTLGQVLEKYHGAAMTTMLSARFIAIDDLLVFLQSNLYAIKFTFASGPCVRV